MSLEVGKMLEVGGESLPAGPYDVLLSERPKVVGRYYKWNDAWRAHSGFDEAELQTLYKAADSRTPVFSGTECESGS